MAGREHDSSAINASTERKVGQKGRFWASQVVFKQLHLNKKKAPAQRQGHGDAHINALSPTILKDVFFDQNK